MANVEVLESVQSHNIQGEWNLLFQWVSFHYDNEQAPQQGYRFIWEDPDGNLRPSRGQARIPSAKDLLLLIHRATDAGWFVSIEATRSDGE